MSNVEEGHAKLSEFWGAVPECDKRLPHMLQSYIDAGIVTDLADFRTRAIPIGFHGDAAPCTKRMSLECVSWSSLMTPALSTKQAKWLISGLLDRCSVQDTAEVWWSYIAWSLASFLSGKHPRRDPSGIEWPAGTEPCFAAGTPLCGPFFFVLWQIKSDMDFISNYFGSRELQWHFLLPLVRGQYHRGR